MTTALSGIQNLQQNVDTLIVIPNDRLPEVVQRTPYSDAFKIADDACATGFRISDL